MHVTYRPDDSNPSNAGYLDIAADTLEDSFTLGYLAKQLLVSGKKVTDSMSERSTIITIPITNDAYYKSESVAAPPPS